MENMPMWTHLSNQIFPSQFSVGKAEPGKVSKMVEMINQVIPGIKEGFIFFKRFFSTILSEDSLSFFILKKKKEPQKRPLVFNQL